MTEYIHVICMVLGAFFIMMGRIVFDRVPPDREPYEGDASNDVPVVISLALYLFGTALLVSGIIVLVKNILQQ